MRAVLLVDDEEQVLFGLRRALRPCRDWTIETATSGRGALESLARTPFDAIVSDAMMPEMDGERLLTQVRERWPSTLRVVLSGQVTSAVAHRLSALAQHLFPKPVKPHALYQTIESALATRDRLRDPRLRATVSSISNLPLLPAAYDEVSRLLADPRSALDDVAQLVESDVGLAADVLRLANSVWFGLPTPVTSVRAAVRAVGISHLRPLVLASGVYSGDSRIARRLRDEAMLRLAFVEALAVRQTSCTWSEVAATGAILCDVSVLALSQAAPEDFARLETRVASGERRIDVEVETFGADHAVISSVMLGQWRLPPDLGEAVLLHHAPHSSHGAGAALALATLAAEREPLCSPERESLVALLELFQLSEECFEAMGRSKASEHPR